MYAISVFFLGTVFYGLIGPDAVDTVKMPFGHHGGNHPVRELASGRVLVTSQNHNYVVEESSLPREVGVTHINLTDGTLEGLALPRAGVEAVQYHPEASPGPNDSLGLFTRFAERCRGGT